MNHPLYLGTTHALADTTPLRVAMPAQQLTTHAVVTGMTGSGKTGLLLVLAEEAIRANVPVLMIDVKGDLANLLLTFPEGRASDYAPWLDAEGIARDGDTVANVSERLAADARGGLASWGLTAGDVADLHDRIAPRVITPGTSAGEMLDVLSAVERPSALWSADPEAARESLGAGLSLLLRLIGRDADPTTSRDHAVLSVLAERRLRAGESASVRELLHDLESPPVEEIGAMALDAYFPKRERHSLAAALNTLLASPAFESWRTGAPLDVGAWLRPRDDGRTPAVIVSVAHLGDDEREMVLGLLLQSVLAWVRGQNASSGLRALVIFDEVYGWIPPHPANPATKAPLVKLIKQGRAFGMGVVLATQNPMDLDYRALSNAGTWFIGRLQTDADRARVVDAMGDLEGTTRKEVDAAVKSAGNRWWVVKQGGEHGGVTWMKSRWALSWLKGPMTRAEIKRAAAG